jgi:tRNA(Arg) A34 adenosine deaminase TadA
MIETDMKFLREAFAVAQRAQANGNHPFGAILVNESGEIILEGENTVITDNDCTGHAETNLVREASHRFDQEILKKCTLYASAEPCAMCTGAIFWSGIGRLVFGLSKKQLNELVDQKVYPQLMIGCREILATGQRVVKVEGPALEDEAAIIHQDF